MRLGIVDIGSNKVHLLIADVRPGGRPLGTVKQRTTIRLMNFLGPAGEMTEPGVQALVDAAAQARALAETEGVQELLATATSAVREATNGPEVIVRIEAALGQPLEVLDGDTEARFTFLAVRRWFGWSAGRIQLLDIGGGSLELAIGGDEQPELAASVPLGGGRMTVQFLPDDPPGDEAVERLRAHAHSVLAPVVARFRQTAAPDLVVGSSKAIRSLAGLAGYPMGAGRVRMPRTELAAWIPRLAHIPGSIRAELPGITPDRTFQIVAAAVVIEAAMDLLGAEELDVSPWALREGVLLRYIEALSWSA